ncbi:MAG: hypothetical protein GY874_05845, partial [Desulfobacteraceae bacterium]|nr:hypothetical protein [Desulfobacteraceae bacterium]
MFKKTKYIMLLSFLLAAFFSSTALATQDYQSGFDAQYPDSSLLNNCAVCHTGNDTSKGNEYSKDWKENENDFTAIESMDSDGDGVSNIEEIEAGTLADNCAKPCCCTRARTECETECPDPCETECADTCAAECDEDDTDCADTCAQECETECPDPCETECADTCAAECDEDDTDCADTCAQECETECPDP